MTATEQNEARIEAQMRRIVEQSTVINRQAQTISDLLDACNAALGILDTGTYAAAWVRAETAKELRAAIAKAKGTTP